MISRIDFSDDTIILYDFDVKPLNAESDLLNRDGYFAIEGGTISHLSHGDLATFHFQFLSKNKKFPMPPVTLIRKLILDDINPK